MNFYNENSIKLVFHFISLKILLLIKSRLSKHKPHDPIFLKLEWRRRLIYFLYRTFGVILYMYIFYKKNCYTYFIAILLFFFSLSTKLDGFVSIRILFSGAHFVVIFQVSLLWYSINIKEKQLLATLDENDSEFISFHIQPYQDLAEISILFRNLNQSNVSIFCIYKTVLWTWQIELLITSTTEIFSQ